MTRRKSVSGALTCWIFLATISTIFLDVTARAQQSYSAAQLGANSYYQAYAQAHQNTINGFYQRVPQEQFAQLLRAEVMAWNSYLQAQNAANAQAHLLGLQQQIANIDATINNWISYIQNLYNFRNAGAYATDPNYHTAFDNWVKQESAQGNNYIAQLRAVRVQVQSQVTTVVSQPIETPRSPAPTDCGDRDDPLNAWCELKYYVPR